MRAFSAAVRGNVPMASIEPFVRLKKTEVEHRRRTVAQIKAIVVDFERLADSLEHEISAEEARTKNHDPSHFAYSTLATATRQRRNNLKQSVEKFKIQLDAAEKALRDATEEMEAASRLTAIDQLSDRSDVIGGKRCLIVGDLKFAT
jgi:flagellar FliJ protein